MEGAITTMAAAAEAQSKLNTPLRAIVACRTRLAHLKRTGQPQNRSYVGAPSNRVKIQVQRKLQSFLHPTSRTQLSQAIRKFRDGPNHEMGSGSPKFATDFV